MSTYPYDPNISEVRRESIEYSNAQLEEPHHHHHLHKHHHPETRERVEVVEYDQAPENRFGVVYKEDMDVETNQYYTRRNRPGWP
ncbi:uncharacterized protein LOC113853096 [Abrus precatorius]|uniref:Uncharacterized protein LOC113853096 n=1 Tax=Abrus precatorius TaxID=3816 RepID=A0A8B8K7Y2_ABRPR|nr:uncharacterized protein LOC113853096 [Abrus precatorius]